MTYHKRRSPQNQRHITVTPVRRKQIDTRRLLDALLQIAVAQQPDRPTPASAIHSADAPRRPPVPTRPVGQRSAATSIANLASTGEDIERPERSQRI